MDVCRIQGIAAAELPHIYSMSKSKTADLPEKVLVNNNDIRGTVEGTEGSKKHL